jgi:hypothetical protein
MMHRIRSFIAALALATVAILPPFAALAQNSTGPPCAERTQMVARLGTYYRERLAGLGLSDFGWILELYVGPAGTWTVIATAPTGMSCFIAWGEAWNTVKPGDQVGQDPRVTARPLDQ